VIAKDYLTGNFNPSVVTQFLITLYISCKISYHTCTWTQIVAAFIPQPAGRVRDLKVRFTFRELEMGKAGSSLPVSQGMGNDGLLQVPVFQHWQLHANYLGLCLVTYF